MARKSAKEARDWIEFTYGGREFVSAKVPKGNNAGRPYKIAKRIGERYEVRGFFASGGCGLLLRGRDLHTQTDVLIKTTLGYDLRDYAAGRDIDGMRKQIWSLRKQLQTERRVMVWLRNRGCNAVPNPNDYVFDSNPMLEGPYSLESGQKWLFDDRAQIDGEHYLVMEHINGDPVDKLIGQGLPEPQALRIMANVCYVLKIAHKPMQVGQRTLEIVYQDLKPANIVVDPQGYVSLLDWGGCRLTIVGASQPALSGANTPGYCPPECDQIGRLTPAADSYTVGSTLYHMLTGKAPTDFMRSSLAAVSRKALAHHHWDWELLSRRVRPATFRLVKQCLSEVPNERPQDGEALYDEVAALLG